MIPYKISNIVTKQFAIFPEKFVNGEIVNINTNYNFNLKVDFSEIRCSSVIQFIQKEQLILVLEVVCNFDIAAEGVDFIKNENKIPVDFLRYMATIVVGTARGIIHSKTEGSVLNSIVLPPINLVDTIQTDFQINEKSNCN
jgi:hypothetical protein